MKITTTLFISALVLATAGVAQAQQKPQFAGRKTPLQAALEFFFQPTRCRV